MEEDGRSAENESPDTTIAVGERWRLPVLDILRRRMPGHRWLQFAAAVEERHLAAFVRYAPKRRDEGQGLAASLQSLRNVLTPLTPSDLTRGAETDQRPAYAPPGSYQPHRRTLQPGSQANLTPTGLEFRTAVPRRPATTNSRRAKAGALAGDGRIDERLPAGALHGLAHTLDPYVQAHLSRLLDLRIPAVRIHTGQAADAVARRLNADAVSFGPNIMFRAGKFAQDSASGLGLLGHELTHVAHTESDRFAGSSRRAEFAREELVAVENERRVLQHTTGKPVMPAKIPVLPRETTLRASRSTPAPRAASVDRGVGPAPADAGSSSLSPELSAQQLGALKDAIYRDLMDRIRTEFERGG